MGLLPSRPSNFVNELISLLGWYDNAIMKWQLYPLQNLMSESTTKLSQMDRNVIAWSIIIIRICLGWGYLPVNPCMGNNIRFSKELFPLVHINLSEEQVATGLAYSDQGSLDIREASDPL